MSEVKVEKLFDLIGSEFDSMNSTFLSHYEQMSAVCRASFAEKEIEDKIVLDAGCGTGTASIHFARNGGKQIFGVDLSLKSLAVGFRWSEAYKLENVKFQQASLLNLPFKDGYFDIVFSCGAIPYVVDIFAAIDELIRVTNNNGTILLFLLKKSRLDTLFEISRSILSRCSIRVAAILANILALAIAPFAGILMQRDVKRNGGKPLSQTILEGLFSPVGLSRVNPDGLKDYFTQKGFGIEEIRGIDNVDFYSSETIFVCKARRLCEL